MIHSVYGNILASVDLECTGTWPNYHEPIQIAVVPLNNNLEPLSVTPFYRRIRAMRPDRADSRALAVHGLYDIESGPEPEEVQDAFVDWVSKLGLPMERSLAPLAHNWPFECGFLKAWLGVPLMEKLFFGHPRDSMQLALQLNDRAVTAGRPIPFEKVGLGDLCKRFGIVNEKAHDALSDCIAEAKVYRHLLLYQEETPPLV